MLSLSNSRKLKSRGYYVYTLLMVCSSQAHFSLSFASALSDPSSRLSTSPPPPAIAVPLLEMGFSLRQIAKAMEATGKICFIVLYL